MIIDEVQSPTKGIQTHGVKAIIGWQVECRKEQNPISKPLRDSFHELDPITPPPARTEPAASDDIQEAIIPH